MTFLTDFSSYTGAISVLHKLLDFYSIENVCAIFNFASYLWISLMYINLVSCLVFSCQTFWEIVYF